MHCINNYSKELTSGVVVVVVVRGLQAGSQGFPNGGNRLQVSDIFSLSLKQQEETNYMCQIFFS